MRAAWPPSHEALAADGKVVVAERSKHDIAGTQPELVIDVVRRVLR